MKELLKILCLALIASHALAQDEINLKQYYKNLDYFNSAKREVLLNYEAKFTTYLKSNLTRVQDLTAADAKTILYGTLFLTNTNQGVRFQQISYQELIRHQKLSLASDLKSELIAREELILANLKIAKKITPKDQRIDAWIATHEMYSDELRFGQVSTEIFQKMMSLAKRDVFSYTAMAVISNELNLSGEQQKQILELANLVRDGKIPCIKNTTGNCFEHRIAPQTNAVGKLITGDIFLRDASRHVEGKEDIDGERIKSGVSARVIYGFLQQKKRRLFTLNWGNIYLKARIKAVKDVLWKQESTPESVTKSLEFKRGYSCIACHAGGR